MSEFGDEPWETKPDNCPGHINPDNEICENCLIKRKCAEETQMKFLGKLSKEMEKTEKKEKEGYGVYGDAIPHPRFDLENPEKMKKYIRMIKTFRLILKKEGFEVFKEEEEGKEIQAVAYLFVTYVRNFWNMFPPVPPGASS